MHIPVKDGYTGSSPVSGANLGVVFNGSIRDLDSCGRGSSPRTQTNGGYSSVVEPATVDRTTAVQLSLVAPTISGTLSRVFQARVG